VEEPDRRETNGRERAEGSTENDPAEDPTQEVPAVEASAEDAGKDGVGAEVADPDEHRRRLEAKDWHIRELYDEVATLRLVADEAVAKAESDKSRVEDLEEERARLKERLGALEEEERGRRRQREGQDRRVARLERELERREAEIQRLEDLLESREDAFDEYGRETQKLVSRKDVALDNALSRIEGLQRDLEERENEAAELRTTVDELRTQLDLAYERRRRVAEPSNRLRSGIDLFNDSEHLQSVDSISRSLGLPEVRVFLGEEGNEPQVILTFTWGDVARRTYFANPGLAVEGPRVSQVGADEDPPGAEREPPNAHLGPDGRVFLGL
jgi:chromosome segregation ATPase